MYTVACAAIASHPRTPGFEANAVNDIAKCIAAHGCKYSTTLLQLSNHILYRIASVNQSINSVTCTNLIITLKRDLCTYSS